MNKPLLWSQEPCSLHKGAVPTQDHRCFLEGLSWANFPGVPSGWVAGVTGSCKPALGWVPTHSSLESTALTAGPRFERRQGRLANPGSVEGSLSIPRCVLTGTADRGSRGRDVLRVKLGVQRHGGWAVCAKRGTSSLIGRVLAETRGPWVSTEEILL